MEGEEVRAHRMLIRSMYTSLTSPDALKILAGRRPRIRESNMKSMRSQDHVIHVGRKQCVAICVYGVTRFVPFPVYHNIALHAQAWVSLSPWPDDSPTLPSFLIRAKKDVPPECSGYFLVLSSALGASDAMLDRCCIPTYSMSCTTAPKKVRT